MYLHSEISTEDNVKKTLILQFSTTSILIQEQVMHYIGNSFNVGEGNGHL